MTVALPPNKRSKIQQETSHLLHCISVPTKTLSCLVGRLVAAKPAVTNAPLHYQALQCLKISVVYAQQDEVSLTQEAMDDLSWWSTQLHLNCTSPILKPDAAIMITSDVSLQVGHWIKDSLQLAGINTEVFTAHSTRGASTTCAATRGVPIGDILKAAIWCSSSTFEWFYYRPSSSTTYPRTILQPSEDDRYYDSVMHKHILALNVPYVNQCCTLYLEPPKYN